MIVTCKTCGLALLGFGLAASAIGQTSYPPGEPLLGPSPLTSFPQFSNNTATATQVDVAGPGFDRAWRVETRVDSSPAWAIELKARVPRAVESGDVALLRFMARAVATTDESGAAYLRVAVQKASPEWDKSHTENQTITNAWTEFFVPFDFDAGYAANAAEIAFGFGFKRQTIELGGFDFVYYGKSIALASLPRTGLTYFGREADAPWRTAALARIEQIRKRDFVIEVVDAGGRAVPGAAVSVEQRRSAFQFGSALQMARLASNTAENQLYQQKVLELFNAGGPENDLKWPPWAGDWGAGYSRGQAIAGLTWMKNHGLHVRGHVLVWPGWNHLPNAIRTLRGTPQQNEIPGRTLAHITDILAATRDLVDEWDVLNEPYANHDLMDLFGPSIQADWFRAARAAHATAPLYLNDYQNHDASLDAGHVAHFEATARYLQEQAAPIGGLGLQAHFSANPSPPTNVLAVLDRYASLGLPVRITEFDVNTDDEQLQADYTRDFLIAVFSHAAVVGFQMWGFWERAHWIPGAAMLRADFSEKPNAHAYKALVLDQWRTRASGVTDAQGSWRGRGFHGDYVVRVELAGRMHEQAFFLRAGDGPVVVRAPLIASQPVPQSAAAGGAVALSVLTTGTGLGYQWARNGAPLAGATSSSLAVTNLQPGSAGLYTVLVTASGTSATSQAAILGVSSTAKLIGAGSEFPDLFHPGTGFTYDQILLEGAAATTTADSGQILRTSYIDLNDDIVQVEFSGAGALTLVLEGASGPAAPQKYNQAVAYMKGHAGIVITGADATTNVAVFSVGRAIPGTNPNLYRDNVTYDGFADLAFIAIASADGKFGGLRAGNTSFFAERGLTGVHAPGVQFTGPVYIGDIHALAGATPVIRIGSGGDVRITGGDLFQGNNRAVQVSGVTQLRFTPGTSSHGTLLSAQTSRGRLEQDGADVTSQIVVYSAVP